MSRTKSEIMGTLDHTRNASWRSWYAASKCSLYSRKPNHGLGDDPGPHTPLGDWPLSWALISTW